MKVPKFMNYLLKNNFKDKKILLNLEEYRNFTYEKNIVLDEDCIIHIDNRHYQHIVNYSTGGKEKELRSSQFNTWSSTYILEDRTANFTEMAKCFLKLQDVSYVEITMDKNIKDINKLQKDNFPREIKFLDENKKIVLKQEFNEFGFMVKAIDKTEKIVFEDREIMKRIDIEKLVAYREMMEESHLYLFDNVDGKRKRLLTKLGYDFLSYEKAFDFGNGKLLVNNKGNYQHKISFTTDDKFWKLRAGNFKNTNIFWEDRSIVEMIYLFEYSGKSFEYVDLEMDREITNIQEHQKNNFPKKIKFLNKDKEVVLKLIFNDYGFLIRVIDEFQNTVYEDKEVLSFDSTEGFILSKIKE